MAIIGFARVGDKTDHGGVIVTGDTTFTIDGQIVARIGDKATCPRCKRVSTIVTSRYDPSTTFGIPIAYDGDYLDCGAKIVSSLNGIAGYDEAPREDSAAPAAPEAAASPGSASVAAAPEVYTPPVAPRYSEWFVLQGEDGASLGNQAFTATLPDGAEVHDSTDGSGRTPVLWTQQPDTVFLRAEVKPKAGDDPYHYALDEEQAASES